MRSKEKEVKKALDGGKKDKLHTHAVKYERADNGGIHAHVERHTKGGHHHTEHHVLANTDDAAAHLQEQMGDQPAMGEQASPDAVEPPQQELDPTQMAGGQAGM